MVGRTHDLAALTALTVVVLSQPPRTITVSTAVVAFLGNQIGGIAPDIDAPTAPLWRNLPIGGYVGRVIARMLGGHRFLTHSVVGLVLAGIAVSWLLRVISPILPRVDMSIVWWAFMIGMVSHLIMDSFTREGVPWLLPVPIKFGFPPLKSMRIVTGKKMEKFIVFPLLALLLVAICYAHSSQILQLLHRRVV